MSEGSEKLVNSFLFVTNNCFLVKRGNIRIRNGKERKSGKNNGMGERTDEELGKVMENNGKSERRWKKIEMIRNSWHYLPF